MRKITLLSISTPFFLYPTYLIADEPVDPANTVNQLIIGEDELKIQNIENIKDIFDTTSGVETDGESLNIRGVGDDGRGIAVTDDGVSLTEISGAFSTDIDTSELEKLIVYKGPGSIYSVNGTGGVLKAKSKSVFKMSNNIKASLGSYGYEYFKVNAHHYFDIDSVINLNYTSKKADNDYKEHSKSEDQRYTLKFGRILNDSSSIEASIKSSDIFREKIQSITDAGFQDYLDDKTVQNTGLWIFNSRDTQKNTVDTKYKHYFGNDLLRISAHYSTKEQTYYNDGKINVNNDNYRTGADVEYEFKSGNHSFLLGSSYKMDEMENNKQYQYADITTGGGGVITSVTGTSLGEVMSDSNSSNYLFGVYARDDYQINDRLALEASLRVDRINFDVDSILYWQYKATQLKYVVPADTSLQQVSMSTTLYTPRLALVYSINKDTNTYISLAQGERSINDTQILVNIRNGFATDIDPATSRNIEIGLKHSSPDLLFDVSVYQNIITDEIIEVKDPLTSTKYYENAGEVDKKGLELGLKYTFSDFYYVGSNYSYMDYKYVTYNAASGDYSGNTLRSTPDYKYALYAGIKHPIRKIGAKLEVITSGRYYTDDANSQSYEGYKGVTNLMLGWEPAMNHKLQLNVNNLLDKRFASDAIYSSTTNETSYTLGEPRTLKLSYKYTF